MNGFLRSFPPTLEGMGELALETPDFSIAKIPSALLESPLVETVDSVAKFEVWQTLGSPPSAIPKRQARRNSAPSHDMAALLCEAQHPPGPAGFAARLQSALLAVIRA